MNNLPLTFSITFDLKDFRGDETTSPETRTLSYMATITCGEKRARIWSQPLTDDEVGTPQSFYNVLDMILMRMQERLCEETTNQTTKPNQP